MTSVRNIIDLQTLSGLSEEDVPALQKEYGKNIYSIKSTPRFLIIFWNIVKEPMFILLCFACALYFIAGEIDEGFLMLVAMLFVAAISVYQEVKSFKAIETLKEYTEPKVVVVRDNVEKTIASSELVPGDIILLEEGNKVPADAAIIQQNDLSVNESIITGESLPATKSADSSNILYQGTTINSGKCFARVTATGNQTQLGKLGRSISAYSQPETLLQKQIGKFVHQLALFGFTAFIIILAVNYINSGNVINSFLFALTLAMAVIPEEIPVAFSSFMAIGAFYMAKRGIISRQPQTIENLGAVSVICLDKTGTITENKMEVKNIYDHATSTMIELDDNADHAVDRVLEFAMLASEKDPFDALEKAIWRAYKKYGSKSYHEHSRIAFEYPLEGHPPVMTHVYDDGIKKIAAAKGGAERIISKTDSKTTSKILNYAKYFASQGNRVIGVASAEFYGKNLPVYQDDFDWKFEGLISLHDPVKENTEETLQQFYKAGIRVKLLTGDYPETAMNVATQIKMKNSDYYLTGTEVIAMDDNELKEAVKNVTVFARMFPDAKLKVIEALKSNGEIVAMTGDGVNDGPALKAANIGIAMGHRGTDIARQASDLVITDDKLEKIVEAIEQGRKIFSNLKKAVRYIVSIHIPIILTASLPVLLGWKYPNIFSPIHIIFLELIMGPTCSIFFEREPVEKNFMSQKPRERSKTLFYRHEILLSIAQGVIIAVGVLVLYYHFMQYYSLALTRTIVFSTLIICNILLTFTNRSFTESIFKTIRYKNSLAPFIIIISLSFLVLINFVPFLQNEFLLADISIKQFLLCALIAFISVMWFELYKSLYKVL